MGATGVAREDGRPAAGPLAAGPPPAGPLDTGGRVVPADWIDYNGHMMDAYYFVAFTEATEALLDHVGLGAAYRAETGCGMYTVEGHICFRASVRAGQGLRYSSQLLGCDAKRLHVFHRLAVDGTQAGGDASPGGASPGGAAAEAATIELMFVHVDLSAERGTAMPPDRLAVVTALAAEQAALPVPAAVGRHVTRPGQRQSSA